MANIEVQGIVSMKDGKPRVQIRFLDDDGAVVHQLQLEVSDSREFAQNINEASFNATYEASLAAWLRTTHPENYEESVAQLLGNIRRFRADNWGQLTVLEDWRKEKDDA